MIAFVLFASFAVLLLIGAPIAVCLGVSSTLSMIVQGAGRPLEAVMSSLPMIVSASTSKFVLLAIPFFILAGNIMEKAGISEKLIILAEACIGHVRGGIAIVCVVVACFFAAISGSGPATVASLGVILIPAMIKPPKIELIPLAPEAYFSYALKNVHSYSKISSGNCNILILLFN